MTKEKVRRCAACKKILADDNLTAYCHDTCKEVRRSQNREHYLRNREKKIAASKQYKEENPDKVKRYNATGYQNRKKKEQS